jgi:hypothetical protein
MIKRPTWILVVVLALIAGLAYYMQTVPDNFIQKVLSAGKTPTVGTSRPPLISLADAPLKGISITDANGHSVALKHETSGWTLSIDTQSSVPADQSFAEQAASQAQTLQLTAAEIKPPTSDLSGFGLDKPAYIYKLVLASGKTVTFKIGKATITGDGYYLQREDGTIVAVEKYTMETLLNLLKEPPYMFPLTPTPTSAAELPTGTITPIPAAILINTATPGI